MKGPEISEHPILFTGEMVRAILDGRKTQTRRLPHRQPFEREGRWCMPRRSPGVVSWYVNERLTVVTNKTTGETSSTRSVVPIKEWLLSFCHYGVPGDRLWVRETWAAPHDCDHLKPREIPEGTRIHYRASWEGPCGLMWRPSIFVPRWASRITLEITDVRVERVQDISETDALAEGVEPGEVITATDIEQMEPGPGRDLARILGPGRLTAKANYSDLWDEINGNRAPWSSNPWVWAISFRRAA